MTANSIELRQVRDFGEILNATFAFLRENFMNIMKTCLPVALPIVLGGGVVTGFAFSKFFGGFMRNLPVTPGASQQIYNPAAGIMPDLSFIGMMYFGYFILAIGMLIYFAAVYQYIILYLDHPKDQITFQAVWSNSKGKVLPLVGLGILMMILLMGGFLLFIIPGIYMMIPLSFTFIIYMAEKKGVFSSIGRSFNLLKGEWWATLGLAFVMMIIQYAISLVAVIPFYIILFVLMFHNARAGAPDLSGSTMSAMGIAYGIFMPILFLITLVTTIIQVAGISLKYFSIVEKREGIGMMQKVEEFGTAAAGAP